jgi:hypothetical protein
MAGLDGFMDWTLPVSQDQLLPCCNFRVDFSRHLVLPAHAGLELSSFMQEVAGEFAGDYNRRKD